MIAQTWTTWAMLWAVLLVATASCGLYCGLETGVYVLNKIRLDLRAEAGNRQARRLRRLLRKPNSLLAVLLIGTNLSSYAVAFAVTVMFEQAGTGHLAEWYALAVATGLLFVLGDSVPKNVFQRLTETLTYRLSWLLSASDVLFKVTGLSLLVRGVSWLIVLPLRGRRTVSDERLSTLFAEGRASGVLTHMQSIMADRVMNIAQVALADVMVPLASAACARREATRDELLGLIQQTDHSRLPVRDEAGQVVGILDVYDVLADASVARPADRATEPLLLASTMAVTEALYHMQRAHQMMAIVRSADRPVGMVTIKDLVEEIVGELEEW